MISDGVIGVLGADVACIMLSDHDSARNGASPTQVRARTIASVLVMLRAQPHGARQFAPPRDDAARSARTAEQPMAARAQP